MKITLSEYQVLFQTLVESLTLSGDGRIFSYTRKSREELVTTLYDRGNGVPAVEVQAEEDPS